jgi:phthiocerol/phenolphthiocerol synthesis type-I polyketide synthase C
MTAATYTLIDRLRQTFMEQPQESTYRFLRSAPGPGRELLSSQLENAALDRRIRALAARIRSECGVGERALIVCEPGLDYLIAFFASLYAGVIAVPVYPPNPSQLRRSPRRLASVVENSQPSIVLAATSLVTLRDEISLLVPQLAALPWLVVGDLNERDADSWRRPPVIGEDIAFLQYTSGSTGDPKGVMVSHANLLNQLAALNARFLPIGGCHVTWLPPYHDMGLIGALLVPALGRGTAAVMDPMTFLKRPLRWLEAIAQERAAVSGAPNFAFDLCVKRSSPQERAELDLSSLRVLFSGAEPVRAATLDRFAEAFAPAGLDPKVFMPCYGLAEVTLCATSRLYHAGASKLEVNKDLPGRSGDDGSDPAATRFYVSCGVAIPDHEIAVVDPMTFTRVHGAEVGEIWVHGPSVTGGYWGRATATAETFRARITGGDDARPWFRSGDLGFIAEGELYVAGRLKDVIIVEGRNHYPDDIEDTAHAADRLLRPGGTAAFGVGPDRDELVVVQEVPGHAKDGDAARLFAAVQEALMSEHGLRALDIVLVRPGIVPKTTSGKVRRSTCRMDLLDGKLDQGIRWRLSTPAGQPGSV